jgi:short subunit dehydrogenase-like uncharacterized protein
MTDDKSWLIYGAYGYSGELIAREAANQGLKPILAGRSEAKLAPLAGELDLAYRTFDLDDPAALPGKLEGVGLVLNCAGPFSATAPAMIEACLAAGAHYLDITGEIDIFEHAFAQHWAANEAGVVLCPGVGFDVIPTDCVAAHLAEALPDATHLALGFDSRSGFSPGTAKTSVEGLAGGGKVRKGGGIATVPLAFGVRRIDFGDGEKLAITIPWGDVATAWYTTGTPDIEVYIPGSPGLIKQAKRLNWIRPLLNLRPVQSFLKSRIEKKVKGPDAATREKLPTYVWGEVVNAEGDKRVARIKTANGYTVTIYGSLEVVKYLLGHDPEGGTYTPSKLVDKDLVKRLPGSGELRIEAA